MSLFGALNIGGSALATQQAALQVTGNNIANSADPNYVRETAVTTPGSDQQIAARDISSGRGVNLTDVQPPDRSDARRARLPAAPATTRRLLLRRTGCRRSNRLSTPSATQNTSLQVANGHFLHELVEPGEHAARSRLAPRSCSRTDRARRSRSTTRARILVNICRAALQQQISSTGADRQIWLRPADRQASTDRSWFLPGGDGGVEQFAARPAAMPSSTSTLRPDQCEHGGAVRWRPLIIVYVGPEPLVIGTTNNGITVKQQKHRQQ